MVASRLRKCSCLLVLGAGLSLAACAKAGDAGAAGEPSLADTKTQAKAPAPAAGEAPASLRRVVKKASLELVVSSSASAQAEAGRIAERFGGFVATSSRTSVASNDDVTGVVSLTLRVPSSAFARALDALRALGNGDGGEQVRSEDVSEEFVDLEARIQNQEKLEQQFHELLKRADKVEQALLVHREITGVRTEIDRLRGRKHFLEHETALSTVELVLTQERPLVTASFGAFERSAHMAYSDAVNLAAGLVTFTIRASGVLLPLAVFFGLPLGLVVLQLRRRKAKALAAVPS